MRKYLLPNVNQYKANLHCHSTISDGRKTPEELKSIYQSMGYCIVAYTDHDVFITHNDLTDDSFLALNGLELEINEQGDRAWHQRKCCHICFVALDPDNTTQPMWNDKMMIGNAKFNFHLVKSTLSDTPQPLIYSIENISEMMKKGRDNGFFVTYNHPTWSRETYTEYTGFDGMHAMEMFNGGCIAAGYEDYNPRVYDDMLSSGKRMFCIGTDDNHNASPESSRHRDSGVAFTVILADKLEYKAVTDAMLRGEFYCSEGPIIHTLYTEDGKVHIECSAADRIICTYETRRGAVVYDESGESITSADFNIDPSFGYYRITVVDKQGKHACTNAYFPD